MYPGEVQRLLLRSGEWYVVDYLSFKPGVQSEIWPGELVATWRSAGDHYMARVVDIVAVTRAVMRAEAKP